MGVTRRILNWYARLSPSHGVSAPPYQHVIQIGDPRLRKISELVPVDRINTKEVQNVIKKLEYVVHKYGSLGMSAPQIGINWRIFVMRISPKQISETPLELTKSRSMEVIPFTVFINPTLKVTNYHKITLLEGCESVQGYMAEVARYKEVEVTGHNENGESISKIYKNWSARLAQHEMEHLDGKLYVDIMDRKTLACSCWEEVNLSNGNLAIPFSPQ